MFLWIFELECVDVQTVPLYIMDEETGSCIHPKWNRKHQTESGAWQRMCALRCLLHPTWHTYNTLPYTSIPRKSILRGGTINCLYKVSRVPSCHIYIYTHDKCYWTLRIAIQHICAKYPPPLNATLRHLLFHFICWRCRMISHKLQVPR